MKNNQFLILAIVLGSINLSCNQMEADKEEDTTDLNQELAKAEVSESIDVEQLVQNWNDAWNNGNAEALKESMQEDVHFMAHDWVLMNREEVMDQFVNKNMGSVANLKSSRIKSEANDEMAVYAGSYTHDVKDNGEITGSRTGTFTYVWEKQADGNWRLSLVQITESPEKVEI